MKKSRENLRKNLRKKSLENLRKNLRKKSLENLRKNLRKKSRDLQKIPRFAKNNVIYNSFTTTV